MGDFESPKKGKHKMLMQNLSKYFNFCKQHAFAEFAKPLLTHKAPQNPSMTTLESTSLKMVFGAGC